MRLDLEERGYEYGGDIAARYPGFTPRVFVVQANRRNFT